MSKIADNIKKYRQAKHMTQDQLAEKLNVTRQAVSNWETGKTQPDIDTLTQIAEVFEISIEELIYEEKKSKAATIVKDNSKSGIGFGVALAIVLSYTKWQSIGWAIFHGLLGWVYVIYYAIKY